MIQNLKVLCTDGTNPYENLAVEEVLLDTVEAETCILYLWQNENTVVIGQNQNAFLECRTGLMEEEGVFLARRKSGGGAVYHDLGNLNFTFLMPSEEYDLEKQLSVLLTACRALGLTAEQSGRNDVLIEGRKFSGNAFYRGKKNSYHHGTILVRADMEKLSRYLSPSKAKMEAKGVKSVKSRVVNLREFLPTLTIEQMKNAMVEAFGEVYGLPVSQLSVDDLDKTAVKTLKTRNEQWDYNYGSKPLCNVTLENRFPWGGMTFHLTVEEGRITNAKVYSDAMEHDLPQKVEACLISQRFSVGDLSQSLSSLPLPYGEDLAEFFRQQEL
ncbi:MAG: lipoate--protein ligase [Oscillospiraceae bacterium]|nr:lipoate--protein ligase [Oscillospiraceae bacterium]